MTTITRFTKEQLIKRLEEQQSGARYALSFVQDSEILRDIEMDLRITEIARASLEAEPVSFDALRDAVAEVSGGAAMEWSDIYKGHQAVPFINFNSLARIVDKFRAAPPAPTVTFYRDGIEAAAAWVDQQRESYDSEHGRHDPGTGTFEFGNDAQRDYSATLEEIAEGIRGLHPNTAPPAPVVCQEPIAWLNDAYLARGVVDGEAGSEDVGPGYIPVYREPLYAVQPAAVVPDDLAKAFISAIEKEQDRLFGEDYLMDSKDCIDVIREEMQRLNACRAALLQGSQPVSNRDELPPSIKSAPELDSVAKNAELLPGNSPVTPDSSEDTKRLDWLDYQNKRLNEYYGTAYGWKFDANFQRNAMMLNDSNYPVMTVRQAIDQAIASAQQQEVNRE